MDWKFNLFVLNFINLSFSVENVDHCDFVALRNMLIRWGPSLLFQKFCSKVFLTTPSSVAYIIPIIIMIIIRGKFYYKKKTKQNQTVCSICQLAVLGSQGIVSGKMYSGHLFPYSGLYSLPPSPPVQPTPLPSDHRQCYCHGRHHLRCRHASRLPLHRVHQVLANYTCWLLIEKIHSFLSIVVTLGDYTLINTKINFIWIKETLKNDNNNYCICINIQQHQQTNDSFFWHSFSGNACLFKQK